MIVKLVKRGNSQALTIPKSIWQLLNIDMDTELEITTDGKRLFITPLRTTQVPENGGGKCD